MQGSRFVDEFDRYYAESLSGGVRIPDPNSVPIDPVNHHSTTSEVIDCGLETIPDNGEENSNGENASRQTGISITGTGAGLNNLFLGESHPKNVMTTTGDRRWSNASSRASSRSRSSSSGSSQRGLSIPERVAVTREGLVEQIIEKWRAAMDDHHGGGGSGKIIITDDENNSRFHDFTSSSSSSTSGSRPRANTFSGRSMSRSPPQNQAPKPQRNSEDPLVDSSDCAIGDIGEQPARQRAYSTNAAAADNNLLGTDYNSSRRSSGGQIFHFAVERRPSVASRILSFLGARPEPKRCEIAIRQLTPLEAGNIPSSAEIKTMELLLIGQEGVGRKEIVRSLLTAATAPPVGNEIDRNRLPSIDSEISWDEQTCIIARSYLEVDSDIVNFTARCASNEEETDRCLAQAIPDVILAIYSVADFVSVAVARTLLGYSAQRTPKRTALCMVANKADLSGIVSNNATSSLSGSPLRGLSRELSGGSVNRSAGRAAAKSVGASWLETSAVISLNIRTLLAALLQHWIQNSATTIVEEQSQAKESSRRSSINRSNSGSFRNALSSNKPSRTNSLLVRNTNNNNNNQNETDESPLSRTKSEKHPSSRSPSAKLPRPSSHSKLISACHPLFSALCVSKASGAADDKNSSSNDSGVQDSPHMSNKNGNDRNESVL